MVYIGTSWEKSYLMHGNITPLHFFAAYMHVWMYDLVSTQLTYMHSAIIWIHPQIFEGSVFLLFILFWVVFLIFIVFVLCLVSKVDEFQCMSILDCPFDFFWRLFKLVYVVIDILMCMCWNNVSSQLAKNLCIYFSNRTYIIKKAQLYFFKLSISHFQNRF